MSISSRIVPALIPTSDQSIRDFTECLLGVPEIHIDVVDGNFVPFTSWPYVPTGTPMTVKTTLDAFTLEVDLMVQNPLIAADDWIRAGADMVVFHVETIPLASFSRFIEQSSITVGVAAHNDTPLDILLPYVAVADYVQVMGIASIGAQGQSFDERVFDRVTAIVAAYPDTLISIDGSMNEDTIPRLESLPVHRVIVGSAITKATDPRLAYDALSDLLSSTG